MDIIHDIWDTYAKDIFFLCAIFFSLPFVVSIFISFLLPNFQSTKTEKSHRTGGCPVQNESVLIKE
jgi:TRAP-type mannitol/chloroaromatic compound transport system permease small subunit